MKNFLSPVARTCAEFIEMTSNAAQAAWHGRSTVSADPIDIVESQNSAESRKNYAIRRPSILTQRPQSATRGANCECGAEPRDAIHFNVANFCSELDSWRASLISPMAQPIADEHQYSVKQDSPAAKSRVEMVPCGPRQFSASLESDVTRAVRSIECGPVVRAAARPPRSI